MDNEVEAKILLYQKKADSPDNENDRANYGYYKKQAFQLEKINSLETYFAEYNIIPKYGFPIDVVKLEIYNRNERKEDDSNNLTRDLSIAISEYAPDSEIIVNKRKYTSRYIALPPGKSLEKDFYVQCDQCHHVNESPIPFSGGAVCEECKQPLELKNQKEYLIPQYGFIADQKNKETSAIKPIRTYAGDILYIGQGKEEGKPISLSSAIKAEQFANDQLLVLNQSNFFFCDKCGYTYINNNVRPGTTEINDAKPHIDYRGYPCSNTKLKKIALGHKYDTDVLKISIDLTLAMAQGVFANFKDDKYLNEEIGYSLLYALMEGLCDAFEIDRDDVNGTMNCKGPLYSIMLFDTTPGGAGNVRRAFSKEGLSLMLSQAEKKVSQHCCSLDTSCYNCLRRYSNQKLHPYLKRGLALLAIEYLQKLVDLQTEVTKLSAGSPFSFMDDDLVNNVFEGSQTSQTKIQEIAKVAITDDDADYGGYMALSNGKKISLDFIWQGPKVLLFKEENEQDFIESRKIGGYKSFLINNHLDTKELEKALREGK